MYNFTNQHKISILYFISLIVSGYFVYPFLSVMLFIWAAFYFLILWRGDEQILNSKEVKIWRMIVFGYPIFETLLKAAIIFNFIPYSWRPLNIAEHGVWAMCMYLMLLPYTKYLFQKLHNYWAFVLIIGLVIIFGNINEVIEFVLRNLMGLQSQRLYAAYYLDTTIDLVVNLSGAIIGASLTWFILNKNR